jgi:GntR family transcriptional regulator
MFRTGRDHELSQPYYRLQQALADLITATPAGQRLLSEPDLARQLGVSRATLREAMRTFESQGLIRRRQGIGTFVVGHSQVIESGLEVLESIEKLAHQINLEVSMGDFQVIQLKAGADEATELNVEVGTLLIQVVRVITAEDRPVAYLVDLLPQTVLSPADLDQGFTGSVLDFLLRRGDPQLSESRTEIQAVASSSETLYGCGSYDRFFIQLLSPRLFPLSCRPTNWKRLY